jgi:Concanavalin A-like lectin/glucanases superfamily
MQKVLTAVPSTTPVPDLAWYKLDNDIMDYKVYNIPTSDASSNGTPIYVASHLVGQNCYSFSGGPSSNWVNLPPLLRGATLSFSCWINMSSVVQYSRLFDYGGTFRLHITNSTRLTFNDLYPVTYTTGFLNVWKHIALTINGTTLTFYENGVVKLVTTMATPLTSSGSNPSVGYMAHSYAAGDPNPSGKYSDFRMYGRVISAGEITTLYNN